MAMFISSLQISQSLKMFLKKKNIVLKLIRFF